MKGTEIKLGYAPTRRSIFSAPDAIKYRGLTKERLENIAALKVAMRRLADQYGCNAVAIQCWNALQGELGIMPCAANSLLNEEGLPVVCETDIHGAITAVMAEAADLNRTPSFFADWTVRHPDNENGELLQHCGPLPPLRPAFSPPGAWSR